MGQLSKKGGYGGYVKANKEREKLDFYATPPLEAYNILRALDINLEGKTILDNSCGNGNLILGLQKYLKETGQVMQGITASDVKDRGIEIPDNQNDFVDLYYLVDTGADFLSPEYAWGDNVDIIFMNPPYSIIVPFTQKSLELAKEKVIMLARTKFVEGKERYEKIFAENPPQLIYQYVDRICCAKNNDFVKNTNSIEAYAWFIWDKTVPQDHTELRWLRRYGS